MKKLFFISILFFSLHPLLAQTQKVDVLVVGNTNAAVAAAIQAAQSNVKTILLLQSGGFHLIKPNDTLTSGIEATFIKKLSSLSDFDKQTANQVMSTWTDSVKNLTVIKNVQWVKASRSGKNWSLKLANGKTIKSEILINVADARLNQLLKINLPHQDLWKRFTDTTLLYKTSVASGESVHSSLDSYISMYDLIPKTQENFIQIEEGKSMRIGQATGAIAAFAGFFDMNTSEVSLRKTQAELLNFKLALIPLKDVSPVDTNWKSIQMIALTGMVKPIDSNRMLYFKPDENLATEIIKQTMKDHFYKAQIWFDDYKNDMMSLSASLDLIRYVGNKDSETLRKEVEKKWNTSYAFESKFDLNKIITRREFAVILNDYAPPFVVTIDKKGKIIR